MINYLMLDKDDITIVHGTISRVDVIKELKITSNQFKMFVDYGKIFRDKYILIDDYDITPKERKLDIVETKLLVENDKGKKYYAKSDGTFYVVYKSGKIKYLSVYYSTKGTARVKIGIKQYEAQTLIAKSFIKDWCPGSVILYRDENKKNISANNLLLVRKEIYAKRTGSMSRSKVVGLFEQGQLKSRYRSARRAGKVLNCSYQTISDICNKKVKKPMFDVRWL